MADIKKPEDMSNEELLNQIHENPTRANPGSAPYLDEAQKRMFGDYKTGAEYKAAIKNPNSDVAKWQRDLLNFRQKLSEQESSVMYPTMRGAGK